MKKLLALNFALALYFAGLICSTIFGFSHGAVMVLIASVVITILYAVEVRNAVRDKKHVWQRVIAYTILILITAELFIVGYSVSIGQTLLSLPLIFRLHTIIGFCLLAFFLRLTIKYAGEIESSALRKFLLTGVAVSVVLSLIGFLGFVGWIPNTVKFIYYAFVFLLFFYLIFFLLAKFRSNAVHHTNAGLLISMLLLGLWLVRWQFPNMIDDGLPRVVSNFGFAALLILPAAILMLRKMHFLTVFVLYVILLDIYFISFDRDFKYLVDVGVDGCEGYESVEDYPIAKLPVEPIDSLFREPTSAEIESVVTEWKNKDFAVRDLKVEYEERHALGGSLKVISHRIGDRKHYGLIRIPPGVNCRYAPILLALHGGGVNVDFVDSDFMNRIAPGLCREVLDKYVVVAPSFRGDVVKGNGFCFRSEGYTGDVWAGAAEDAAYFLEAAKAFCESEDDRVLALGISRGATVALIMGGLTDKLDQIIAISTHTDFINTDAFKKERVGSDFPRVFFTPETSLENIRRRMLTSSPIYFTEHLPAFEIHQGTEDVFTTVQHTRRLHQRLQRSARNDSTYHIYYYEGKVMGMMMTASFANDLSNLLNDCPFALLSSKTKKPSLRGLLLLISRSICQSCFSGLRFRQTFQMYIHKFQNRF